MARSSRRQVIKRCTSIARGPGSECWVSFSSCSIVAVVISAMVTIPSAYGDSKIEPELREFITEKVRFAGYTENLVGLMVAEGDETSTSSNRMMKQRFTINPELNVDFSKHFRVLAAWRFVKEIRYGKEVIDRANTTPPRSPPTNRFYDESSFVPRELVLDFDATERLTLRWGRQFISWGETDGLRLLDVINPQNSTFAPPAAPNLFSLDETRISQWGLRVLYNIRPMSNTALDFFYLPGIDDAEDRVDDTVSAASRRLWSAHPETREPFGRLFADPLGSVPVVIPNVTRKIPLAGQAWKIGAQLTHSIGKLNVGLGYIYGFNPQGQDMVFRVSSIECEAPAPSGEPCLAPTVVNLNLLNDRTSIYAAHFNYAIDEIWGLALKTAIRGEFAFYPGKSYNISQYPGPDGLIAGPDPEYPDGIIKRNTLRYALGFDRTTFIPFLQDDPWRPFRMSLQIFQQIILGHKDGIRVFSTAAKVNQVSTVLTFRVSTGYLGDTILPDLFVAYSPDGYWAANPAVSYIPPWSERIRLSLIAALYGGKNKFKSFGLWQEKSSIFLRMRYQFGG